MLNKDKYDLVCLGELLVDMFSERFNAEEGETEVYIPKPGGAPANVAVAASRLGLSSAFIGKVGNDPFGHWLKGILDGENVSTRGLCFDEETKTTLAIISDSDTDMPGFIFYRNPGADQQLTEKDLDRELLRNARILHLGSLSLSDEPARSATYRAVEIARQSGALISYDVNYRSRIWKGPVEANHQIKSMLSLVDLVKVNEVEAALITGITGIKSADLNLCKKAADNLIEFGPYCAVITLGSKGSYFQFGDQGGFVPAYQTKAIDMVGCGDAFVAGLLRGISLKRNLRDISFENMKQIVKFANAVGALTSTRRGAIPAMPTLRETEQFITQHAKENVDDRL